MFWSGAFVVRNAAWVLVDNLRAQCSDGKSGQCVQRRKLDVCLRRATGAKLGSWQQMVRGGRLDWH